MYMVLTESRIRLKPVLEGVRIVTLSISYSIKPSLVFSNIAGSLQFRRIRFCPNYFVLQEQNLGRRIGASKCI